MYLFGPITSGLSERYGCKVVAFLGGLLCFLGLLLTSFVSDLSKLYMTYGVLWGIGSSFCYFPTLTAPGEYFCQRLSLVNGIVTAGKFCLCYVTKWSAVIISYTCAVINYERPFSTFWTLDSSLFCLEKKKYGVEIAMFCRLLHVISV